MKIQLKLTQAEIEDILRKHLQDKLGALDVGEITIYVKSKQNYRATWEECSVLAINEEGKEAHNEAFPKDRLPVIEAKVEATS